MPDQGGLQLLPETRKKIDLNVPGENKYIYIGLIVLAVVVAAAFGLGFYLKGLETKIADIDASLADLEKRREPKKEQGLLLFQRQSAQISSVLNNHIFWTQAFQKMESLLQPNIKVISMQSNTTDNSVQFTGEAPNYLTLARQVAAFTNDDTIVDVSVDNVKINQVGRITFALMFKFNKSKFLTRP